MGQDENEDKSDIMPLTTCNSEFCIKLLVWPSMARFSWAITHEYHLPDLVFILAHKQAMYHENF